MCLTLYAVSAMEASELLRTARREAGLTQAELARRAGTTQSAIARMERRGANPTVAWLDRALGATGRRLQLDAAAPATDSGVDETLTAEALRRSPAERVRHFEAGYASARALALAGARARGELA
jgi:transcriptional regulator with XRE-family HTH domain